MAENNVFTLDSGYLTRKKQQLMSEIRYAEYKVGNTWRTFRQRRFFLTGALRLFS